MIEQVPLVSIGLPVYNGATTLERAIDSLLAQNFKDFELIIVDDCSSDATPQLCEAYAERDARVRFMRNARNLGTIENLQRVVGLACGEYFLYASQDDIWAPSFISRMIETLETPPGAIAAMCAYRIIYPDGEDAGMVRLEPEDWPQRHGHLVNAISVVSKRGQRMRPLKTNMFVHGLVRLGIFRESLRSVADNYLNERQLVCQFALAGRLVHVDEVLFTKQQSRQSLFERHPRLVLKRQSMLFPHLGYIALLCMSLLRSRIVPKRRRLYIVPISVAFLWETVALETYARLLGVLKKTLPPTLFSAFQRLRGRR